MMRNEFQVNHGWGNKTLSHPANKLIKNQGGQVTMEITREQFSEKINIQKWK